MQKFSENDIRPDKFTEKMQNSLNEDIRFLRDLKSDFCEVLCPACLTKNDTIELSKNDFTYIECCQCKMLYMSPRPTVEILSKFYPNSKQYQFFNEYIFPASIDVRREKIFKPRVNKVLQYCEAFDVEKEKLIEIGTGYGIFCEEMVKKNVFTEVVGVEASDSLAKTCLDHGYRLYNGLFEELEIHETFNVVVAFEVLEHVFEPKSFLEKVFALMHSNSLLMLTFPAWTGFDTSVLREHSSAIDHEHLNYFTEKSISHLLQSLGFDVLEISTPGELDVELVRKTALQNRLELPNFLKNICIDNYDTLGPKFQEFLKENKLSSHMMVIARK